MAHEGVLQLRFQLILVSARAAYLHRANMRLGGNLRCRLHDLNFGSALVQAHIVQQVVERDEFVRRRGAEPRLAANHVDPVGQAPIEILIGAHCVINALAPLDQARQNVIDIGNREGIIGAIFTDGALLAGTIAIPELPLLVLFTAKKHIFAVLAPGDQHRHRFRLRKAGQVLKVTVLPIGVFNITIAHIHLRRWQHSNAVGLHLRHQCLAPTGVFLPGNMHAYLVTGY